MNFPGCCLDSGPAPDPLMPWSLCAGVVLEAVAWLAGGAVYRGETASLLCNISVRGGPAGLRLATSWWVERPEDPELSSAPAQLVGGMGQDGVAKLGVRPGGGPVSVELVGPRSHRLRLHSLGPEDEGIYHCTPSAWVQHADYSWYQVGSARSGPVTVYPYLHGECLPRHPPSSPPSSSPRPFFPPSHLTLLLLSLLLPQRPSAQAPEVEVDECREGRDGLGGCLSGEEVQTAW